MNSIIYNFPLVPCCLLAAVLYIAGSFFFERRRAYFATVTLLSLLLAAPLAVRFVLSDALIYKDGIRYIAYSVSLSIFAAFAFALCNMSKYSRCLKYIIFAFIFAPVALCVSYFAIQHAFLNVDALIAIWQTNFREAAEYLKVYLSLSKFLAIAAMLCLPFAALTFASHGLRLRKVAGKRAAAAIMLFLCADALVCRAASSNSLTLLFTNAREDIAQYRAFKQAQQTRKKALGAKLAAIHADESKGVYVLVIGESHTREYTHAYGYPRQNSPWLDQMSKADNCILFRNAYACHTQTVPVLSFALTAKNQYNGIKLQDAVSLVDAACAAGYETVWLSNQMKYGVWDTPVAVIASGAAQQKWLNNSSGNSTFTASYDGALIPALDKVRIKDKMLIVIHLMGSHINYNMRYPREFNSFGTRTDEDSYANSLLYNDFVMKGIYEKARSLPNFRALLYVSDHASIPKEGLDHDSARFTPSMTHIPMYLCWTEQYKRANAAKIAALTAHRDAYFTNDLLFNLQLSLMGITIPSIYEPQNDFASMSYNGGKNRFRTSGGTRKLK